MNNSLSTYLVFQNETFRQVCTVSQYSIINHVEVLYNKDWIILYILEELYEYIFMNDVDVRLLHDLCECRSTIIYSFSVFNFFIEHGNFDWHRRRVGALVRFSEAQSIIEWMLLLPSFTIDWFYGSILLILFILLLFFFRWIGWLETIWFGKIPSKIRVISSVFFKQLGINISRVKSQTWTIIVWTTSDPYKMLNVLYLCLVSLQQY